MKQLINRLDNHLTAVIQSLPAIGVEPVMTAVSVIGLPEVVGVVGVAGWATALHGGNPQLAWQFIGVLLGGVVIGGLKVWLKRLRPETPYVLRYALKDYSFPSGHSGGSLLVYGLIAYYAGHAIVGPLALLVVLGLIVLIGLIGVSRVYLGAHFPSDVLGAWIFSGAWLLLVTQLKF